MDIAKQFVKDIRIVAMGSRLTIFSYFILFYLFIIIIMPRHKMAEGI